MAFSEVLQILITANGSQAVGEFQKVGASAKTNLGGAEKSSGGFAAGFKKNAGLIAGSAVAIGAALKFSIDGYLEQEAAEIRLQNSMKNNPRLAGESADAFIKQADGIEKVTAAAGDQIVSAQAMLATFRMTGDEVRSLTPLVVDYARKFDTDLVTAAKQVGKAMDGQVGALKRNGVTIDEVRFKTDRYGAVMDALSGQVGGFAQREGKTLNGQLAIMANQFGVLTDEIGGAVVPVLLSLLNVTNDVIGVAGDLGGALGDVGVGNTAGLAALGAIIPGIGVGMGAAAGAALDMRAAFKKGFDVDEFVGKVRELEGANKKGGDSAGKAAEQFRRQQEAIKGATDAMFGLIDADLAAESANLRVESAARRYNEALAENGAGSLEAREALNSYKSAIVAASVAAGDAAAQALGPQASAQQKSVANTNAQIATLRFLAAGAAPEARAAIEAYIAKLREIPGAKNTTIGADAGGFWGTVDRVRGTMQSIGRSYANPGIGGKAGGAWTPFAHGGVVKRPTFSLIGEAGPEAVIPLSRPNRAAQIMSQAGLSGGGGGTVINVTVNAPVGSDAASIGRSLQEYLDVYRRRAGLN